MNRYSETYHAARLAGARPIFLLYLGTDFGLRCFGKHTPIPAQVGDDAFEWSARVLAFGDFRQALSSESEQYLQGLFEEEVSSYGCELDNADGYFTEIAGREVFLNGDVQLLQGYEYPGFVYADFIPLFYGNVDTFEFDKLKFKFTAIQALKPQEPADPTIDTTTVYAMSNAGTGFTGATGNFTYANTSAALYGDDSWEFSAEIDLDDNTIDQSLFKVENSSQIRYDIGIDSSGFLYLAYNADVSSPSLITKTSSISVPTGKSRVSVVVDDAAGTVAFSDDNGNVDITNLATGTAGWTYDSQFGSAGTGNGQFDWPGWFAIDGSGHFWVVDIRNDRVQEFDTDGTYLSQFGSTGTGNGQFNTPNGIAIDAGGNIWVVDNLNSRVQQFSSSGSYISQIGTDGSADGQLHWPSDIFFNSLGNLIVADGGNDRIQEFTTGGSFVQKFGSSGTGNGQFNDPYSVCVDSLDNIYVCDEGNDRVQKFDASGTYLSQFGSNGTGDGQFDLPANLTIHPTTGDLYVTDQNNDRIQWFNSSGVYQGQFGSSGTGNGQFNTPEDLQFTALGDLVITDRLNNRVQVFSATAGSPILPDFTDTGTNDDVTMGDNFDGDFVTCKIANTQYVSTSNLNTDVPDIDSGLDVPLDDGTWVDSGIDLDTNTDATEEEEEADPTQDVILPTTGNYADPGENNQNVVLPLPYGNLRENSDGGVWVAPCIDAADFVYCVAGWPIQSVANGNTVEVYVDGVLQSSGYTFDESNDYESQGNIAIVDFTSDPGGTVTVKCNGKWVDGSLLTDPVDIIEDFLDYAAELLGNAAWQKEPTSFALARAVSATAGYKCAGVIQSNNSLGFWIKAILKSFLGGFRFNSDGELEIKLTPLSESQEVQEWIAEYEAITLNVKQLLNNVCGRIIVNYAVSYTQIDRRYKEGGDSSYFRTADKSQSAINPQSWTLDFDWCRNSDNIDTMQNILLALYADPEYNVNYNGQDFKFVPLGLTDQIQGTLSLLRDSDNNVVEDVVFSLREKTINLDNFTTAMLLQSVNFVNVAAVGANNVTLNNENVTLDGEQVTLGA